MSLDTVCHCGHPVYEHRVYEPGVLPGCLLCGCSEEWVG